MDASAKALEPASEEVIELVVAAEAMPTESPEASGQGPDPEGQPAAVLTETIEVLGDGPISEAPADVPTELQQTVLPPAEVQNKQEVGDTQTAEAENFLDEVNTAAADKPAEAIVQQQTATGTDGEQVTTAAVSTVDASGNVQTVTAVSSDKERPAADEAATASPVQTTDTAVPGLGDDDTTDPGIAAAVVTAAAEGLASKPAEGVSGVQIFFARGPPGITDATLKEVFGAYGEVLKVQAFMDRRAGISKGCGFVDMATHDQAKAAIEGLDDKFTGGYAPLAVKWPDPTLRPGGKRKADEVAMPTPANGNTDNTQVFIARIPRTATDEQTRELFQEYGTVQEVNLFKSHPSAPHCKGCGMVTMGTHAEAAAALAGLDNTHKWEGMDSNMVVKWVDRDLQKRRKEGPGGYSAQPYAHDPSYGVPPEQQETAPAGCDRDAFKLYVNNIPRGWEVDDMRPLIETYGEVVEFVLVRDKVTKQPKGSGFLWYKQRSQAEAALTGLNNQMLDAGRPLSVMRARPRTMTPGPAHSSRPGVTQYPGGHGQYHQPPPYQPAPYGAAYGYGPAPTAYAPPQYGYAQPAYAPPAGYAPAAYDPNQQYGGQQGYYAAPQAGYQ